MPSLGARRSAARRGSSRRAARDGRVGTPPGAIRIPPDAGRPGRDASRVTVARTTSKVVGDLERAETGRTHVGDGDRSWARPQLRHATFPISAGRGPARPRSDQSRLVGGLRVGAVTVDLQVAGGDGPPGGQTLVVPWGLGETRITQETCPGLGTLQTSRGRLSWRQRGGPSQPSLDTCSSVGVRMLRYEPPAGQGGGRSASP